MQLGIALLQFLTAVVLLATSGNPQLDLGETVSEITLKWYQRKTTRGRLCDQMPDFILVQQQLARSSRIVLGVACLSVMGNMHADQVKLAIADDCESSLKRCPALSKRLYFASGQNKTGLKRFEDFVIVTSLPVRGRNLARRALTS